MSKPLSLALVLILAIAAAFLAWRMTEQPTIDPYGEPPPPITSPETDINQPQEKDRSRVTEEQDPEAAAATASALESDTAPIPNLETSDTYLRERFGTEGHPLQSIMGTEHLIRKVTTAVELLSAKRNPAKQLHFLKPEGTFLTVREGDKVYLDPANYARYETLVSMAEKADVNLLAGYYQRLKPVFDTAYGELGNLDKAREDKFREVLNEALAMKVVDERIELLGGSGIYIFANPDLEALTPLQKAFIRMGPENTRRLQTKLREIRRAIQ